MQAFDLEILDERKTCRTVLDALDRLDVLDTAEGIVATIHAGEIQCPNGETPGLVSIGTGAPGDHGRRFVRLPDSNTFRAKFGDGTPIYGAIHELDGGSVEPNGSVLLSDGRHIRSVELQPGIAYRHYDFSWREHFVVHQTLRLIGEEDRCYRFVDERLLPGLKWLDYNAIQQIRLPNVKKLIARIQKILCLHMSDREIENILRLAGMQFPRQTRSANRRSSGTALA